MQFGVSKQEAIRKSKIIEALIVKPSRRILCTKGLAVETWCFDKVVMTGFQQSDYNSHLIPGASYQLKQLIMIEDQRFSIFETNSWTRLGELPRILVHEFVSNIENL